MPDASKPFKVRTTEGTLHTEHDNLAQAEAVANAANEGAAALDVKARYVVADESGQAAA